MNCRTPFLFDRVSGLQQRASGLLKSQMAIRRLAFAQDIDTSGWRVREAQGRKQGELGMTKIMMLLFRGEGEERFT